MSCPLRPLRSQDVPGLAGRMWQVFCCPETRPGHGCHGIDCGFWRNGALLCLASGLASGAIFRLASSYAPKKECSLLQRSCDRWSVGVEVICFIYLLLLQALTKPSHRSYQPFEEPRFEKPLSVHANRARKVIRPGLDAQTECSKYHARHCCTYIRLNIKESYHKYRSFGARILLLDEMLGFLTWWQIGYEQLCTRWNREEAEAWNFVSPNAQRLLADNLPIQKLDGTSH